MKKIMSSPPYVVPECLSNFKVRKIAVYDIKSNNLGLVLINARHCFLVASSFDQSVLIEAAGMDDDGKIQIFFREEYELPSQARKLVEIYVSTDLNTLNNWFKEVFKFKKYTINARNCYSVCILVLYKLQKFEEAVLVLKKLETQIGIASSGAHGALNSVASGALMGIQFGPPGIIVGAVMGFAVGKFVTKKAHKIKEMLVDKNDLDKYVQNL